MGAAAPQTRAGGWLTAAPAGVSAQCLPGNKDSDGLNLTVKSGQTRVVVFIGN